MALEHATAATIAQDARHRCGGCGRPFMSKTLYDAHVRRCVVPSSSTVPAPSMSKGYGFGKRITLDQQAQRHRLVEEARARLAAAATPYELSSVAVVDASVNDARDRQPVVLSEGPSTALAVGQQPARDTVDGPSVRADVRASVNEAGSPEQGVRRSGGVHTDRPARAGVLRTAVPSTFARTTPPPTRVEGPSPASYPLPATPSTIREPRARAARLVERDEFIVRAHGRLSTKQQAEQLGISVALVSKHRQELARAGRIEIRHRLSDHREWTDSEVTWFRANIGRPWRELSAHLGRSYNALIVAAKRLDTDRHLRKRNRETINALDAARILGVDDVHFLSRQLIPWGLLKAKRSEWLLSGEGPQWEIRREDLVEFLLDYPWQYDRERIKDPFFRNVADQAWKRDPLYTTTEAAEILGFKWQHGPSSFFLNTAPKYLSRDRIVIRRRGNPKAFRPRSFTGMKCFIPRSTIRAIQASGWINYRTVLEDPEKLTAEKAGALLYDDPERPTFVGRKVLVQRVRRFMESGAIPTKVIVFKGGRKPWRYANPTDVYALKPALFVHESTVFEQRLSGPRRRLLERHEPELLRNPRDLALQQATGELGHKLREWFEWEQRAERDLHWRKSRSWALVTKHVARVLEQLGPRTKIGGSKRLRMYHLGPCSAGLVEVPLAIARQRGLEICEHCEFEAKFRRERRGSIVPVVTCVMCRTTYRRGRGRPPKLPTCPDCRSKKAA